MFFSKIEAAFTDIFVPSTNGKVDYYHLFYRVFLILAVLLFFYIMLTNLYILIIFKQSKLFVLLFLFLIIYSILRIIDFNKKFNKTNPPTAQENFEYLLTILVLIFSVICFIYLSGLFLLT